MAKTVISQSASSGGKSIGKSIGKSVGKRAAVHPRLATKQIARKSAGKGKTLASMRPKKPHKYKSGTVALREIRTQQRRTDKSSVPRNCTQME